MKPEARPGDALRFARNGAARPALLVDLWRPLQGVVLAALALGLSAASASAAATTTSTPASTAVVNPGMGIAPPGSDHVTTILSFLAWGVTAMCVAGVFIVGGKMAIAIHGGRGGGSEHASSLGWVLLGAVLVGSASALVGAVI